MVEQSALTSRQSKKHAIDPNVRQRVASDPDSSICVSASAGTGKTKVLTDRVLRLMLPRSEGLPGTPAYKILCLTFTKAAANEMALRVNKTLGEWAIMKDDALYDALKQLMGHVPSDEQVQAAKTLFTESVDGGQLQIMTIHSFCQSVLGRFPLESGLPPYFKVLDEYDAEMLIAEACDRVIASARSDEVVGSPLGEAVYYLLSLFDQNKLLMLLKQICAERAQFMELFERYGGIEGLYAQICQTYNFAPYLTDENILSTYLDGVDHEGLRYVAEAMLADDKKSSLTSGPMILKVLNADADERSELFNAYKSVFLTAKGEARSSRGFPSKNVLKACPQSGDILARETDRVLEIQDLLRRVHSSQLTRYVLELGYHVVQHYETLKQQKASLDYDDLILFTLRLLRGADHKGAYHAAWVMYKLDEGLDHILVDEAQDTNPEQWQIISAICDEFFSGLSARDTCLRTVFTVGDIKQSIYSFQRAEPEAFSRMQRKIDTKVKDGGEQNQAVDLDLSFRSTPSILKLVDSVFQREDLQRALGGHAVRHDSYREGQAGHVELWPLFEEEKRDKRDAWTLPVDLNDPTSISAELASEIALTIRGWLDRKEVLSSYDRAIAPGDILILVRSRNILVDQLTRALKEHSVPVSGADQMVLSEQIVVQDLIVLAQFCLLPDDDLVLASVLKSPFLGWNEDDLFSLSYNRSTSLWQQLCNFDASRLSDVHQEIECVAAEQCDAARIYLAELIGRARQMSVFEFFSYVLVQGCPADRFSGLRALKRRLGSDVSDALDEFLNEALNFHYDSVDHMQAFLHYFEGSSSKIKREMEEIGGQVRIMTVHGAKGLQAPIVILPDTVVSGAAKKPERFLWPSRTDLDIPLYSAWTDDDPQLYKDAYARTQKRDEEEYYRLLYVALTRAEERLYIAGYKGSKGMQDHSWYGLVERAMRCDSFVQERDDGCLVLTNAGTDDPDKIQPEAYQEDHHVDLPDWCMVDAPAEPVPPQPLVPSHSAKEDVEVSISPMVFAQQKRFKRGNLTHKLLQFLPDMPEDVRINAAQHYLLRHAADLSQQVRESICTEVLDILYHPDYQIFFGSDSRAEVPLTGLTQDGRIVSGQIDRLVITDDAVWIIDYKSNRPPPEHPKDVAEIYKNQLRAYLETLRIMYPDKQMHCALLWTDGPRLMIMDDVL